MPQCLMFAENIYNKIKDEELFSHDCIENMNLLMTCIRREIEGTEFKLKFNFIRPLAKVVIASSSDLPVQRLS